MQNENPIRDLMELLRPGHVSKLAQAFRVFEMYQQGKCGRGYLRYVLGCTRQELPAYIIRFERLQAQEKAYWDMIHKQLWSVEFIQIAVFTFTERADRWYTYGSLRYPVSGDGGYAAPNIT